MHLMRLRILRCDYTAMHEQRQPEKNRIADPKKGYQAVRAKQC